jgi:hypothetical protein
MDSQDSTPSRRRPELPDEVTFAFIADDGTIIGYGQEALELAQRQNVEVQKERRRVLRTLSPLRLHLLERRLATGRWPVSYPRVVSVNAPRRVNGPSGRPRSQTTRSNARSGDSPDSDDEPPHPPLRAFDQERGLRHVSRGVERLLRKLSVGLDDQALTHAAQLVLALDENAATDREAVAR